MRAIKAATVGWWVVVFFLRAASAVAATCEVPSASYPTIQAAVDDVGCTEVVLASQTFTEAVVIGRDLTLRGASSSSTVIEGQVEVQGTTTQVEIRDLKIDASAPSVAGCFQVGLPVQGGAQVNSREVVVLNGRGNACPLFEDGFESGDTSAWSSTAPSR